MTIKEKYYEYVAGFKTFTPEEDIVFSIIEDMSDRRGFRQAWDDVDEEIQEEIMETWIKKVKGRL